MYACDQDPIPVITSNPSAYKIFMNTAGSITLTSNSYDPDDGEPHNSNNGIQKYKWCIYSYSLGDYMEPPEFRNVNSSFTFSPSALGLGPGRYDVELNVLDDDHEDVNENYINGYNYYHATDNWSGIRSFHVIGIEYLKDQSGEDEHCLPTGTGETFVYSLQPAGDGTIWEPDVMCLYIKNAAGNTVYSRYLIGSAVNDPDIPLGGSGASLEWNGLGNQGLYNDQPLPPGNYTVTLYISKSGYTAYETNPLTIYEVSIISPSASCDDNPIPTSSWLADPNYRYDFQGIASGATGFYDIYIEGIIPMVPPLSYQWTLTNIGSLNNDTTPTPTISNPTTGEGILTLIAMIGVIDTGAHDTRNLKIYPDHLARDVDNFKNGKACSPNIELPDGSFVTGTLSCSSAATHALDGTTGSGTYLRNYSWSGGVTGDIPWNTFITMNLQRGWVLELKYKSGINLYFLHWQTVKESGTGANAETYAADVSTHKFRHEKVSDYFILQGISYSNRYVKIYKP